MRGVDDSVVLMSKAELESWQETLDIFSISSERDAVRKAMKEKKTVAHETLLSELGLT